MNNKYLLPDLAQMLAESGFEKKESSAFVRAFFDTLEEGLFRDETVKVQGLGVFRLIKVEARESVNVNTGERLTIEEHYKVSFTPDAQLKNEVNQPFAHLEPVLLENAPRPNGEERIVGEESSLPNEEIAPEEAVQREERQESVENHIDMETKNEEKKPLFQVEESKPEVKPADAPASKPEAKPGKPAKASNSETQPQSKKDSKGVPAIVWVIFAVVVLALIGFALSRTVFKKDKQPIAPAPVVTEVIDETPQAPAIDWNALANPASWTTSKVVTIRKGQRLTLISQEYFGDKLFWVYLYQANKDKVANPNHIAAGTRIKVPALPAELIDMSNAEAVSRARQLEAELKARFD